MSITEMSPRTRIMVVVLQTGLIVALLGAVLFLSAGRLSWANGWLLLAEWGTCAMTTSMLLMLRAPALMDARRTNHDQAPAWDRRLVRAYQLLFFPTFILSGLDERWDLSAPPGIVVALGVVGIAAFFVLVTWAPLANPFLETYVRLQTERDHRVIEGGPYRFVRHPAYVGLALCYINVPLVLGSWWGLLPGVLAVLILAWRTQREDAFLRAELAGYAEYAGRVRARWIPGVW